MRFRHVQLLYINVPNEEGGEVNHYLNYVKNCAFGTGRLSLYQSARTIVIDLTQAVMNTSKVMPEGRSASICRNMNDQRRRRAPHPVCILVPALDAR